MRSLLYARGLVVKTKTRTASDFYHLRGKIQAMTFSLKGGLVLFPILAPVLLSACVSQGKYDELQAQYQRVQQQNAALSNQVAADKAQICRLQGAIKYTVNSDLLFPSGGW